MAYNNEGWASRCKAADSKTLLDWFENVSFNKENERANGLSDEYLQYAEALEILRAEIENRLALAQAIRVESSPTTE